MSERGRDKAIVLLSGGLDSATVLAIAAQRYDCIAVSFDYHQRHVAELDAARQLARRYACEHKVIHLDAGVLAGSALTDEEIAVPQQGGEGIPVTYVPARNTVFLAHALAVAEVAGANDIFIGVNAVDYSGYPDCRPAFIDAFQQMANLATKAAVEGCQIRLPTPLIELSKAEIIRQGAVLGVDYALTVSCYRADAEGRACGDCDSCHFRRTGFEQAGVADPTRYIQAG